MLTTETDLIDRALAEDVGEGDVTTEATVAAAARGRATITQKAPGVISGLDVAEAVFLRLDPGGGRRAARAGGRVARERSGAAGRGLRAGAADRGADRAELPRPALRRGDEDGADRARGRPRRREDPRHAQDHARDAAAREAAVAHGGGVNHRIGLFDFILIKENHSALAGGVGEAVRRARDARPDLPLAVEVRDARGDRRGARRRARRGCCSTT